MTARSFSIRAPSIEPKCKYSVSSSREEVETQSGVMRLNDSYSPVRRHSQCCIRSMPYRAHGLACQELSQRMRRVIRTLLLHRGLVSTCRRNNERLHDHATRGQHETTMHGSTNIFCTPSLPPPDHLNMQLDAIDPGLSWRRLTFDSNVRSDTSSRTFCAPCDLESYLSHAA